MINLFSIIGKNYKLLVRSKLSALVIILAPLFIVLLISMAFNSSSLEGVKVGVYSESYSDLTNSVISKFEERNYIIEKSDDEETCKELVRQGNNQICVVFPSGLNVNGNSESIVLHVDHSRINIAYSLINDLESEVSSKSSELGIELANSIINSLKSVKEQLPAHKEGLSGVNSKLDDITNSVSSISIINYNETLSVLNETRVILVTELGEEHESIEKLDIIIENLNGFQSSSSGVSSKVSNVAARSGEASAKINEVNTGLDSLINNVNSAKLVEAQNVVSPIRTEVKSLNALSSNSIFLFPTLITLMMLFGSVVLGSVLTIRERKSRAYFRNFITATKASTFLIGNYLTILIIVLLQLGILFAGAIYLMNMDLYSMLLNSLLVLFLSSTIFIFIGMLIGYLFKSEETSVLGSLSVASLLMFFSNAIIPLEAAAGVLRSIAVFNPVVTSNSILKKIILFNSEFSSLLPELYILLLSLGVVFFITWVAMEITKRKA